MSPNEQLQALDDYLQISADFHLSIVTSHREELTKRQEETLISLSAAGRLLQTAVHECVDDKERTPAFVYMQVKASLRLGAVRKRVHALLNDYAERGAANAQPTTVVPTAHMLLRRYLPLQEVGKKHDQREMPDRRNIPAETIDMLLREVYAEVRAPGMEEQDCCEALVHELGASGMQRMKRLTNEYGTKTKLAISDQSVVLAAMLAAQRLLLQREPARSIIIGGLRPRSEGEWEMQA